MGQAQEGNFTTAFQQNGAPQIDFLLQAQGEYYARTTKRRLQALWPYYVPVIGTLTSYTNALTYSEALTNAAWTATNNTVTDNILANPADGQTTMSRFIETVTNGEHRIAHAVTFTAVPWTLSVFVRGGLGRTNFYLRANDGTTDFSGFFDISAGTVGTLAANTTGKIAYVGYSTYRLSITFTPAAAAGNVYLNVASSGSVISYAGDTAKGMYVWGAQAEIGSSPGPYIPTTTPARTVSAPNVDSIDAVALQSATNATLAPGDPFAYLVDEPQPDAANLARGFAEWSRTYARIPKDVTVYSTIAVTKPTPANLGTSQLFFYDLTPGTPTLLSLGASWLYNGYLWGNNALYTMKAGAGTVNPASSGLFTVTFGANTTGALNWNDTGATIAAAINGLASVIAAGITVACANNLSSTVPQLNISCSVGSTASRFTLNAASLNAGEYGFTTYNSTALQTCYLGVKVTITSHGFASSGNLAASLNNAAVSILQAYTTGWVVVNANTIAINCGPLSYANAAVTGAGPLYRTYTPGVDRLRTKRITSSYLPGVTTGITTPADIPVPDPALNDAVFLALVITYLTGFQTYDADPLALWLGPIYQQTLIQIDMATV